MIELKTNPGVFGKPMPTQDECVTIIEAINLGGTANDRPMWTGHFFIFKHKILGRQ